MASKFVVFSPIFYYFIATLAAIHFVRFALWRSRHTVCVCVCVCGGGGCVRACVCLYLQGQIVRRDTCLTSVSSCSKSTPREGKAHCKPDTPHRDRKHPRCMSPGMRVIMYTHCPRVMRPVLAQSCRSQQMSSCSFCAAGHAPSVGISWK